jgi:hypothetical protein
MAENNRWDTSNPLRAGEDSLAGDIRGRKGSLLAAHVDAFRAYLMPLY